MSREQNTLNFSIQSIDDITRSLTLASLLELSGWPKPGNIHRTKNFEVTRFEHFLAGIVAIQPNFREFCVGIYQFSYKFDTDFQFVGLGSFFYKAVRSMLKWQSGGNVLLGHILILAPLAAAATICLKTQMTNFNDFQNYLKKIIDASIVEDTVNLFQAIRLCNPGGLGKIEKYDINDEKSLNEIKADKVTLKEIFTYSKEYDLISFEYSTIFNIILNEGLPYFLKTFILYKDINIATVNTFLYLLSLHPDTLIVRKSGKAFALKVLKSASEILEYGGISSENGLNLTRRLDDELHVHKGKLNPGTTADLISGIIFCALIFGLKF